MVEEQPKEGEQRFWDQKVFFKAWDEYFDIFEVYQRAEENNSVKIQFGKRWIQFANNIKWHVERIDTMLKVIHLERDKSLEYNLEIGQQEICKTQVRFSTQENPQRKKISKRGIKCSIQEHTWFTELWGKRAQDWRQEKGTTEDEMVWRASLTQWRWVWTSSGSWWWTGKPDELQSMGSQRVRLDWATELNWGKRRWSTTYRS